MGAAASLMTFRVDLRNRTLNYDTLLQHMDMIGEYTLSRVKFLYLDRNKISSLPPQLTMMISLVEIHCTDNWLKWLPKEIRTFTQLQQLRVGGNQLANIEALLPDIKDPEKLREFEEDPESFKRFHILRIGHNKIQHLPPKLSFLNLRLRVLVANNNELAALPLDFFELGTLEVLVLSKNRLHALPTIESMTLSLKVLVLNKNRMKILPPTLSRVQRLQKLYVADNLLESIPKGVAGLRELVELDLSRNSLSNDEVSRSGLLRNTNMRLLKFKPGNPLITEASLRRDPTQKHLPGVAAASDLEDHHDPVPGEDEMQSLTRPGGGRGSQDRQPSQRGGTASPPAGRGRVGLDGGGPPGGGAVAPGGRGATQGAAGRTTKIKDFKWL